MGYTDRTASHSPHKYSRIGALHRSNDEPNKGQYDFNPNKGQYDFNPNSMSLKSKHSRRFSLPVGVENYDSLFLEPTDIDNYTNEDYRQRSNSLPPGLWKRNAHYTDQETTRDNAMSDRKMFAIMTNLIHIIIGIAMTQLGIVGTWYQRYMNFEKDQLRYVLYICLMFIVLGIYGMCVIMKRLGQTKSHRIVYIVLSSLSIIASGFILSNGIRIVVSDSYRTNQTVIMIFDALIVGLSGIEIPAALVGLYVTVRRPSTITHTLSETQLLDDKKDKSSSSWSSICSIILNVAHIVLGLCIAELGVVGVMYRRFMNIDNNGLFAVVFISLSFISVGIMGIYNHATGKSSRLCNRSMYTCASLLAIGSATTIMTFVSVGMSSNQYYAGVEAIVAFDVMILSMSGMELLVGIAATALCLIPYIMAKLNNDNGD